MEKARLEEEKPFQNQMDQMALPLQSNHVGIEAVFRFCLTELVVLCDFDDKK